MASSTDMTKERQSVLHGLFAAYGQARDGERLAVYCEALKEFPVPILKKACKKLMMEQRFLPAIAEIVEAGRSLIGEIQPGVRMKTWSEAYAEIQQTVHDVFVYGKPEWSTPEIAAAVNTFGYKDLCCLPADEVRTASAQLRRFYEDACRRSRERQINTYVLATGNGSARILALLEGTDMAKRIGGREGGRE